MKKRIVVLVILFALTCVTFIGKAQYKKSVKNTASDVWRGSSETDFQMISVYFDEHEPISLDKAKGAKKSLEQCTQEISKDIQPLVVWGKTGDCSLEKSWQQISSQMVLASDTFFLMHRFEILSGSLYPFGGEGVVLNRYAACMLFGSCDIAGQTIKIDERETTVCAVVENDLETSFAFLSYGETDGEVTFFETVIPEFVEGFALESVRNCFYSGSKSIIVSNDMRFSRKALKETRKAFFAEEQPICMQVPCLL